VQGHANSAIIDWRFARPSPLREQLVESLAALRKTWQGLLLIAVGAFGLLGFAVQLGESVPLAIMYGLVSPLSIALGIWLLRTGIRQWRQSEPVDAEVID
jgi:hypothetical protein